MEEYETIGEIRLTTLLRVSCRGGGLYLYIPKDIVEVHQLMAGDLIEVRLDKIRRHKKYVHEGRKVEA